MKLLFFAPHSAIWVHAFPEALIAESLQRSGHKIIYVGCGHLFNAGCVAMNAHGLGALSSPSARDRICRQCDARKDLIRREFDFPGFDISNVITAADRADVERVLSATDESNFLEIVEEGVPIGRYALYEFLLDHKKYKLEFSPNEWKEYRTALGNSLLAMRACRKILDKEQPDRVLVYNSLYSVNRICCELAEARGIPSFFLHAGGNLSRRLQTMKFGRGDTVEFLRNTIGQWKRFKDVPAPAQLIRQCTDHYLELLSSKSYFVYSTAKKTGGVDVRGHFGIRPDQKILLATMSSYDERFAGEVVEVFRSDYRLLFATQIDWVKALVEFVRQRDDLFLLIRVHPREFPNRRETVKSEHARLLEETFARLPVNARVNWPSDGISIYELADEVAVVLNAWSTVGKEMSWLGIPVVVYSPDLLFYPSDLNYVGTREDEYFDTIEKALREGWSPDWIRKTYRWLALEYGYSLIDITESYSQREGMRSYAYKIYDRGRRLIDPLYRERRDCGRRAASLRHRADFAHVVERGVESVLDVATDRVFGGSLEGETQSLRIELQRLIDALYRGKGDPRPGTLHGKLLRFAQGLE
jgi:hypothetical protein